MPYNWKVSRKLEDVIQLRKALVKLFPTKLIPTLEWEVKLDNDHKILKAGKFVQGFLSDLKYIPEIFSNDYTLSFLSLVDEKKIQNILKESEKEKDLIDLK